MKEQSISRVAVDARSWTVSSQLGLDGKRKPASVLFMLAMLVGCENSITAPGEGIVFDVTEDTYAPGEFVEYRLSNESGIAYTYSFCFAVLQRAEADTWVTAGSAGTCIALGFSLRDGSAVTGGEVLAADLLPGSYRFSLTVGGDYPHFDRTLVVDIHTRAFQVR